MKRDFTKWGVFALLLMVLGFSVMSCQSEPSSKKQQKAFHVDAEGNLRDKRDNVVKKKGEFEMKEGYYVDLNGERINRRIDDTKEKINEMVGDSKENMKLTFNNMFNTRVKGQTYTLTDVVFKEDKHLLAGYSREEIETLIETLKGHPDVRIQVQVHTADCKRRADCKELADLRAKVVKDMMVTLGANKEQISSKGIGLSTKEAAKAVADKVEIVVEE